MSFITDSAKLVAIGITGDHPQSESLRMKLEYAYIQGVQDVLKVAQMQCDTNLVPDGLKDFYPAESYGHFYKAETLLEVLKNKFKE